MIPVVAITYLYVEKKHPSVQKEQVAEQKRAS